LNQKTVGRDFTTTREIKSYRRLGRLVYPKVPGAFATLDSNSTEEKIMDRTKLVDEIGDRLRQVFEASPAKDLERNVRAALTNVFSRLDLVTREEFDVQREVLLRTRERLVELEQKLAELERRGSAG